jgi:hypothetical protein
LCPGSAADKIPDALPAQRRLKQFTLSMDIGRDTPKFARKLMFGGQKNK